MTTVEWAADAGREPPWPGALARAGAEHNRTAAALAAELEPRANTARVDERVPFRADRRWSGALLALDGRHRALVTGALETRLARGERALEDAYAEARAARAGS